MKNKLGKECSAGRVRCKIMFSELKNEIIELIDKNRKKEITSKTNFKKAGIYIFYVDDFKDDKIIPFL